MTSYKVGRHSFDWTNLHLPRQETDPFRYEYDKLGSEVVKKLQQLSATQKKEADGKPRCPFDMYDTLLDHHSMDETLSQFWTEIHTVPDWVDWEQLERGQKFLYRYAPATILGFALQGFLGENSGASGVVEVLFLLQVTKSLDSIKPGGEGHTTTVRVRLLHSAVRERILKLVKTRPDYFDVESYGVPINRLDSIHSITTFCCNHMWLQLPLMGVYPTHQDMADYIALFRYVGYLLAVPDKYFHSVAQAKATMESMMVHELQITPTSRIVGHNFVQCVQDLPPINISAGFIEAGGRVLNGDELCDLLGLGRPSVFYYACFRGYCWLVRWLALAQQTFPALDEAVVKYFRTTLHQIIIESKAGLAGGAKLGFQYVPQIGKLTSKEDNGRSAPTSSPMSRPVETFCFTIFMLGCLLTVAFMAILSTHLIALLHVLR
ncbi:hypothetical protein PT974_01580 [Cladobotryum mycophilum]|uniref:ER-bound oxygenase mpaB/mpaB'/Rubber oxygenase catalytic domain-containing protein n=1 Tax=Cladobotryum mycophilum TaxID=491253 RepID=A0ABR0T422_9HYPO